MALFRLMNQALAAAAAGVAMLLTTAAWAQQPKANFADLAPKSTWCCMSTDDWTKARTVLENSAYGTLWKEPSVQEFVKAMLVGAMGEAGKLGGDAGLLSEELKKLGIEDDDLKQPTGTAGAALFLMPAEKKADKDDGPKNGKPAPTLALHFLVAADFGEGADSMEGVVDKVIQDMVKKGEATLTEDTHEGKTIRTLTRVEPGDKDKGNGADAGKDDEDMDGLGSGASGGPWNTDEMETLRFVRVGGLLMVSSHKGALEDAIDHLGGQHGRDGGSMSDSAGYQAMLAKHPKEHQAIMAVLMTDELKATFGRAMEETPMQAMGADPMKIMDALGLSGLQSLSMAMRLDPEDGAAEQTLSLLATERKGLLGLLDAPRESFTAPSFVGAEPTSITTLGFRFDRIIPLVRSVYEAMPEEMRQEGAGGVQAFEAAVKPFLATLASEVHLVTTHKRPYTTESERMLGAIKLKDQLSLATQLTGLANTIGMEARDFQGNQIFEAPEGGMGGPMPAVGIGGGYAFIGYVEEVENALRLAAAADVPKLAQSERFKSAAAKVSPGAVVQSYANIAESMSYAYWTMENAEKIYEKQLAQWIEDEADRREMVEEFRKQLPGFYKKLPPLEVLLKHLGDSVNEVRTTQDGFSGRFLMLKPVK